MRDKSQIRARAIFLKGTRLPLTIVAIILAIVTLLFHNEIVLAIGALLIGMYLAFAYIIPNELEWVINE
jgi:hypothetical protein